MGWIESARELPEDNQLVLMQITCNYDREDFFAVGFYSSTRNHGQWFVEQYHEAEEPVTDDEWVIYWCPIERKDEED